MYSEQFLERFWAKVDKTGECWLWTGSMAGCNYGTINVNNKMKYAHRISLEIHLGRPIADDMCVAHTPVICHNSSCVNPAHLREATRSENMMDKHLDNTIHLGEDRKGPRRFTKEQILSIREDKRKHREIAKDYNIDTSHITNIKNKKRYAWIL